MDKPNLDRNLAGYCGIYCGACDIYCLHVRGQASQREPEWTEVPEVFQKHLPFGPAKVKCLGCRSDDVFVGCTHCSMRACAKKRGIVNSCAECSRYPCFRFALFRLITVLASLEKKLPHIKTRKAHRLRMVQIGVDRWQVEQDAHWRCPNCGARYSWYATNCPSCQSDLSKLDRFARPAE
jgi:hypothetical protein